MDEGQEAPTARSQLALLRASFERCFALVEQTKSNGVAGDSDGEAMALTSVHALAPVNIAGERRAFEDATRVLRGVVANYERWMTTRPHYAVQQCLRAITEYHVDADCVRLFGDAVADSREAVRQHMESDTQGTRDVVHHLRATATALGLDVFVEGEDDTEGGGATTVLLYSKFLVVTVTLGAEISLTMQGVMVKGDDMDELEHPCVNASLGSLLSRGDYAGFRNILGRLCELYVGVLQRVESDGALQALNTLETAILDRYAAECSANGWLATLLHGGGAVERQVDGVWIAGYMPPMLAHALAPTASFPTGPCVSKMRVTLEVSDALRELPLPGGTTTPLPLAFAVILDPPLPTVASHGMRLQVVADGGASGAPAAAAQTGPVAARTTATRPGLFSLLVQRGGWDDPPEAVTHARGVDYTRHTVVADAAHAYTVFDDGASAVQVHRVPFVTLAHLDRVISLLRQQLVFNELLTSCMVDLTVEGSKWAAPAFALRMDLRFAAPELIAVTFQHPRSGALHVVQIRVAENGVLSVDHATVGAGTDDHVDVASLERLLAASHSVPFAFWRLGLHLPTSAPTSPVS